MGAGKEGKKTDEYKGKDREAAKGGPGDTHQLLLMRGILHGRIDVQGSGLELSVLLGTGTQQR